MRSLSSTGKRSRGTRIPDRREEKLAEERRFLTLDRLEYRSKNGSHRGPVSSEVVARMLDALRESTTQAPNGAGAFTWSEREGWERDVKPIGEEDALVIYLDRAELATLMCTPENLKYLVAGFLRSEGLIQRLDDVALMRVCDEERVADVRLMQPRDLPARRVLTSGCGGGVTFDEGLTLEPVSADLRLSPAQLLACMKAMLQGAADQRGTHISALSDGESLLVTARDVGRHNTLDKIWGECLFRGISTEGRMLLTTGRLSSEMMVKAAKMNVPVVASINSPTSRTVRLGDHLGVTVVGYARGSHLSVYSHAERLRLPASLHGA
jgi:FdhD protein